MVHIYLSGPIIHAELRKEEFYQTVVDYLESLGMTVFAPQFLGPAEPAEIYRRDVEQVRKCDILIAEVSNPSLGVGMEIMLAREIETPILLFRHKAAKPLSKMVGGTDRKVLFEYSSVDEVIEILGKLDIEKIQYSPSCPNCKSDLAEHLEGRKFHCIQCDSEY